MATEFIYHIVPSTLPSVTEFWTEGGLCLRISFLTGRCSRVEISIQDRLLCSWVLTNCEINLDSSLLNFVRQAVPVSPVFLNHYRPGLLFANFGDAKTLVRWTRNHIGLLLSISWRCWVLPVPRPRFLLPRSIFGRRVGVTLMVTLARFSYFQGTCKYPSTSSLQRYYFKKKTLPRSHLL